MVKIVLQSQEKDVVQINTAGKPYNIHIGDVLDDLTKFLADSKYSSVGIVTDSNVEAVGHLHTVLKAAAASGKMVYTNTLKAGEQFKHVRHHGNMVNAIDNVILDRKSVVIALGGGVIGDVVGYIAANYLRGIALIQMPTTPLSAADSSIGGKVGIDTYLGKNRWGSFKQPAAVFQNVDFFKTLEHPQIRHYGYDSGWAETLKHGAINDGFHPDLGTENGDHEKSFINYIEDNLKGIADFDKNVIRHAMLRNAIIKGTIVEIDEKEQGIRACLNLGHTFGHALETFINTEYLKHDPSGAKVFPHGDAVGIGNHYASRVALLMKTGLLERDVEYFEALHKVLGIHTKIPELAANKFDDLYNIMMADKKAATGTPRFLLLERLGSVRRTADTQPNGDVAPGGYYLQPVPKDVLQKAFEIIR